MTTNINHLKNIANIAERDEDEVFKQLPSEKIVEKGGVTISKLKNK